MDKTAKIRQLNDAFRTSFVGGQVMLTLGIRTKPDVEQTEILKGVVNFNDFNKKNDPYGEHDCASFMYNGEKIIWKIDYYDKNHEFLSDNPADSALTNRLMTVMTADEY